MSQEKFNEPTKTKEPTEEPTEEEVNRAIGKTKEEMDEYYKSQPTTENVNRVVGEVAAQLGEEFKGGDPVVPEDEIIDKIIDKYEKKGWRLIDITDDAEKVATDRIEGKEIKVVEGGDKFLVFEREEGGEEEEEEEEALMSTEEAVSQMSEMRKIVERYNSAVGLTKKELERAIMELNVSKDIIASSMRGEMSRQGGMTDKIRLLMEKISSKYGIRISPPNEFQREIEELIEKYTKALGSPKDKSSE